MMNKKIIDFLSIVQTCEIFECSERSLKRWVERYNNTGDIIRKDREEGSLDQKSKIFCLK